MYLGVRLCSICEGRNAYSKRRLRMYCLCLTFQNRIVSPLITDRLVFDPSLAPSRRCIMHARMWVKSTLRNPKRRLGESCVYASRFTQLELKRTNLCVLNQWFESAFRGNEHKRKADLNCSTNYVIQNADSGPKKKRTLNWGNNLPYLDAVSMHFCTSLYFVMDCNNVQWLNEACLLCVYKCALIVKC